MPDVSGVMLALKDQLSALQAALNNLMNSLNQRLAELGIIDFFSRYASSIKSILLWSVIIAVAAGILFWLAFSVWKDNTRKKILEEQNSIIEPGDFWRLLQAALKLRWRQLWGRVGQISYQRSQRLRAAARIRQIYIDLLELGAELGRPRPAAITPLEYEPVLGDLFPALEAETGAITQAYLRVRYGQVPETAQEVEAIEESWKRIQAAGDQLLSEKKK
jgi:hypothetical protein